MLDPRELRDLLSYDHMTGILTWKKRPEHNRYDSAWNTRYAGAKALRGLTHAGHFRGRIKNKNYYAHRVAWAIYHGAHPLGSIDHINGIGTDNRIGNLRVVDHHENCRNKARYSNNKSGHTGVSWHDHTGMWQARMGSGATRVHLGLFDNVEDAAQARKRAEIDEGYHKNHGRILAKGDTP